MNSPELVVLLTGVHALRVLSNSTNSLVNFRNRCLIISSQSTSYISTFTAKASYLQVKLNSSLPQLHHISLTLPEGFSDISVYNVFGYLPGTSACTA